MCVLTFMTCLYLFAGGTYAKRDASHCLQWISIVTVCSHYKCHYFTCSNCRSSAFFTSEGYAAAETILGASRSKPLTILLHSKPRPPLGLPLVTQSVLPKVHGTTLGCVAFYTCRRLVDTVDVQQVECISHSKVTMVSRRTERRHAEPTSRL